MVKILCLGNEFIKEDCFAKGIGQELMKQGFEIFNVRDSFELISILNESRTEKIILLDVVFGLNEVMQINLEDLRKNCILSAHDFDAGFILKLIGKKNQIKLIGVPQEGDKKIILNQVKRFL